MDTLPCAQISLTKDFLFTSSESRQIHVWKQPDCTEIGYLRANSGQVPALLAYRRILFTTHSNCKIHIWNVSITEKFRPKITTLPQRNPFGQVASNILLGLKIPSSFFNYSFLGFFFLEFLFLLRVFFHCGDIDNF